jgi:hypothetical protein
MLRWTARTIGRVGLGVAAGLAGTAAMTAVQTLEMKVTGREPSSVPAQAVETVLDVEPESEEAEARLTTLTHWAYGAGLGSMRGLLSSFGLRPPLADLTFFAVVWGAAITVLPSLDLAPPVTEWSPKQVASDIGHHLVYVVAAGVVFEQLAQAAPIRR